MSITSRLWDEPLVRFGLLGLIIFAANAWLTPPKHGVNQPGANDSIVIQQARIDGWSVQYRSGNGRAPAKTELENTINQWIDEEVLYRQALELGLHQNDSIVRRQLIQKMDFVIEGATPLPPATDARLQAFMERNPTAYSTPAKISFQQVFLSRGNHGNTGNDQAIQLLATLQKDRPDSYQGEGDSFILGQQIANASGQTLRKYFGQQFVLQLEALPDSAGWQGPIESGLGLHLIRITKRSEFQVPTLEQARRKVALDYRLEQVRMARRTALDKLRQQYQIEVGHGTINGKAMANAQ